MSDLTQILLVVVVTTLTLTLTIIGIQVYLILKELRERIVKFDPILDNVVVEQEHLNEILVATKVTTQRFNETTQYLSDEVIQPLANLMSVVKSVSEMVNGFRGVKPKRKKYLEDETEGRN